MNMELSIQYLTYVFTTVGIMAFLTSAITQVIKEMPLLRNIQTNVVALVVALILCPVSVIIACQYFHIVITWYYVFASFIAAFIVYLVSTGGWEKIKEMWDRTKYNNQDGKPSSFR